nr:KUP/HAK/KT family potassium transporter [Sphingorhabdus sp. YGSMI21]
MVWSLIVVISIKYLSVVLRADNKGEGGIIALVARLGPCRRRAGVIHAALVAMGVFGASLLYGDGTITRAISVLSAIEAINHRLAYTEIDLNLSEVKGPVMDASNEPTFSRNSAGVVPVAEPRVSRIVTGQRAPASARRYRSRYDPITLLEGEPRCLSKRSRHPDYRTFPISSVPTGRQR